MAHGKRHLLSRSVLVIWMVALAACGPVDGMNRDEASGTDAAAQASLTSQALQTAALASTDAVYTVSEMNDSETFVLSDDTLFDILHEGDGPFAFELVHAPTGKVYADLISGVGPSNTRLVLNLPRAEYRVAANATGQWRVDITSAAADAGSNAAGTRFVGCTEGCCGFHGGAIGCDCDSGRCICADGALGSACNCTCIDGDDAL